MTMTMKAAALSLALLIAPSGVMAQGRSDEKTGIAVGFNGYCDNGLLLQRGSVYSFSHSYTNCGSDEIGVGAGIAGTTKGFAGNHVLVSDSSTVQGGGNIYFDFQLPIVTGNRWDEYFMGDGHTLLKFRSGTYTVQ